MKCVVLLIVFLFAPVVRGQDRPKRIGAIEFYGQGAGRTGAKRPYKTDFLDLGPRLGLSFRITNKTVFRGGYGIYYEQEHPSGPILNAINPPPGGIGAPDASYSGFGFTRDFTAPPLATSSRPTLFWENFSRGTANIPARVAVNAVDHE